MESYLNTKILKMHPDSNGIKYILYKLYFFDHRVLFFFSIKTEIKDLEVIYSESLEKEMATHSSILVWKIPQTEESGGLQFMG